MLAQPLERRPRERLLGFRCLHKEANFHGKVFHGEPTSPEVRLEAIVSVLPFPTKTGRRAGGVRNARAG